IGAEDPMDPLANQVLSRSPQDRLDRLVWEAIVDADPDWLQVFGEPHVGSTGFGRHAAVTDRHSPQRTVQQTVSSRAALDQYFAQLDDDGVQGAEEPN